MKKEDYRIILHYSQLTLNQLTVPYFHEEKGCQFNFFELDLLTQAELQQYESKQIICPVCHLKGKLKLDILYCQNEFQNEQNQFVINTSKQQALKLQKQSFTHSVFSQEQEVFELQKQFNSKIFLKLLRDLSSNESSLKSIEKINQDRNNEIFQIFRKNCSQISPTSIGVINFKLILFYHLSKIKIELDLYDETNMNIKDYNSGMIKIKQVQLINEYIYMIVQQEKLNQLFRGKFRQIFDENRNEAIFYIQSMPGYTLLGESRLLHIRKQQTIMIGNRGSIIVTDDIDQNINMYKVLSIPEISENSQVIVIKESQILYIDYNQIGIGQVKEYNISEQNFIEIRSNFKLQENVRIELSLIHNNVLYLMDSECLNRQKGQISYIIPGEKNSQTKTMKIINHHSYMKVKTIPATQTKVGVVGCTLIGLMFQNSEIVFPGILVINDKDNLIEIELI